MVNRVLRVDSNRRQPSASSRSRGASVYSIHGSIRQAWEADRSDDDEAECPRVEEATSVPTVAL